MNEAELVFSEVLNCTRPDLYLNKNMILDEDKFKLASSILKRRIFGEPLSYILGGIEFMGLEFRVNKEVFIPRQETELLVEQAIKQSTVHSPQSTKINILDIGTGSGCIAVSLAKFLPLAKITAIDISQAALDMAQENAAINNVADKIKFIKSDLFTDYGLRITDYDIIISNPPYIASGEIDALQPEVRNEPAIALDGGVDGLDFYRRIIRDSVMHLRKERSFLIMEIGFNQKDAIGAIFKASGNFEILEIIRDYNSIDRVILAKTK